MDAWIYNSKFTILHWLDQIIEEVSENGEDAQFREFEEIFEHLEYIFENEMETWNVSNIHKQAYNVCIISLYICKRSLYHSPSKIIINYVCIGFVVEL